MIIESCDAVLEILAYRVKPGTAGRVPDLAARTIQQARRYGAVLDDVLYQSADDENLFVHHVQWTSLADARRAAEMLPTYDCAKEFESLVSEHVVMSHFLMRT